MPRTRLAALALSALLLTLVPSSRPAAAQESRWRPDDQFPTHCVDATRPDITLLSTFGAVDSSLPAGSYAFSWATGERTLLAEVPFETCNPANGLLYGGLPRTEGKSVRDPVLFSSSSPRPAVIGRMPTHVALDGSLWAYTLHNPAPDLPAELWASADGGRSWQRRALPTKEPLFGMTVAPADGRALYLLAGAVSWTDPATSYTVFFSPDAGATWERRGSGSITDTLGTPMLHLGTFDNAANPVGTVVIRARNSNGGRYSRTTTHISTDGGRTFVSLGVPGDDSDDAMSYSTEALVLHTRAELLRLRAGPYDGEAILDFSPDGGATWERLRLPFAIYRDLYNSIFIQQAFAAPDVLALLDSDRTWQLTTDGGRSWQPMQGVSGLSGFTYAFPMRALATVDGRSILRELPGAERSVISPALPKALPAGAFFAETGHNLGGGFRAYWERNGGLEAFGYPISEPFRERNPADGKAYLVQYFERARLEYRPALAGRPDEVRLGLLGVQVLRERGWSR